jgi:hypothetical protein
MLRRDHLLKNAEGSRSVQERHSLLGGWSIRDDVVVILSVHHTSRKDLEL